MAKKPVKKKPAPKTPAKKPVKKPVVKAAAKKPVAKKAVAAKPAAKKPVAKAAAPVKAPAKAAPQKAAKAAAAPAAAPVAKKGAKAPVPAKVVEKQAKKEKVLKAKALEAAEIVAEEPGAEAGAEEAEEVYLTDAEGRRFCRVRDCDQLAVVEAYCRYHYLLHWKKIQIRKKILTEGKLERYIEELTARYPDKFLEMLRKDLRSEKEFLGAIAELEIDESAIENEMEDEAQTYIDEVRGMGEGAAERQEEDF